MRLAFNSPPEGLLWPTQQNGHFASLAEDSVSVEDGGCRGGTMEAMGAVGALCSRRGIISRADRLSEPSRRSRVNPH